MSLHASVSRFSCVRDEVTVCCLFAQLRAQGQTERRAEQGARQFSQGPLGHFGMKFSHGPLGHFGMNDAPAVLVPC